MLAMLGALQNSFFKGYQVWGDEFECILPSSVVDAHKEALVADLWDRSRDEGVGSLDLLMIGT